MTKAIILSNGEVRMMTYEEVLVQFDQLIEKFAREALDKIIYTASLKPDKEDVLQELKLQAWEAYRRYNGKYAFSTYLYPRLQHGVHRATMNLYAKKRTNKKGIVSLHKVVGSESADNEQELENILGVEDPEMSSLEFRDLMSQLDKKLTPCEKMMLRVLMEREDGYSVADFAAEMGLSRMGANKKVNKFREKMAIMMKQSGYAV